MKKLCVLFLCLFSGILLFAGNIRITNNGKPEAVIVLPASAGDAADFAAKELQLWIKEISGATLPIVPPGKNGCVQIVLALNPAGMEKDLAVNVGCVRRRASHVDACGNIEALAKHGDLLADLALLERGGDV